MLCLELLCVPKRFARPFDFFLRSGTLFTALGITANRSAEDERSCSDEVFRDLSLSLCGASMGQICDVHVVARRVIVLLHDLDHFVALFVDFDECESDVALGELAHLVLDFEAVGGALRVVVSPVADVLTMTRRVGDMESHLYAISSPLQAEGLVEPTLNIFREVTTSSCRLLVYVSLHQVDIVCEICHVEALLSILDISVGDKSDMDGEASVDLSNVIDDLAEGILGALDPRVHGACAVKDQAKVEALLR